MKPEHLVDRCAQCDGYVFDTKHDFVQLFCSDDCALAFSPDNDWTNLDEETEEEPDERQLELPFEDGVR